LEIKRLVQHLVQAQGKLSGESLTQELLGKAHVADLRCLGVAAVPTVRRQIQRAVEHRRHQREQQQRDGQLEERKPLLVELHGVSSFAARRSVVSSTERSLPGAPGQRTLTASRHRRDGIAAAAFSMSGVVPGGEYGATVNVHL